MAYYDNQYDFQFVLLTALTGEKQNTCNLILSHLGDKNNRSVPVNSARPFSQAGFCGSHTRPTASCTFRASSDTGGHSSSSF